MNRKLVRRINNSENNTIHLIFISTKPDIIKIAKNSFRKIITPQKFKIKDSTLFTKKIGAGSSGKAIGVIDLGDMHIGDKMLDIAILSWTIRENFGKKYESMFLNELGVSSRDKRLEYYRLVYDLNLPNYKKWDWIKE